MTTTRAVRMTAFGGPETLAIETVELPPPGPGEAQVRQTAIGFNFIDVYQRRGAYPLPTPTGLGHEAAGVVEAVGDGVADVKAGDRVAYMNAGLGAYAERRNVPADKLVKLPDGVSDEAAAALIFKGMTAQYLVRKTHPVAKGDLVVVHAAAGGVGQILVSWASALGAEVVGTAGGPEKCEAARKAGAAIAIDYGQAGWAETLLKETGGRKARLVYDSVGRDTFLHSLDICAPFGLVVLFGAASGPVEPIDPELLNKKGCLFLTRPSVFPHNADPKTFRANAADLFGAIESGAVKLDIGLRVPFSEIAEAHRAAEARRTTGAIVIVP